MSEVIGILDGLNAKDKRKTIAKKLIEENVKAKYGIDLPMEQLSRDGVKILMRLINDLVDALAESASNP
ncbi:MAG: hypothetical protein ABSD42_09785 [Candidatus Bathyarchaeia archaeon]|jgi:hypothetical protein